MNFGSVSHACDLFCELSRDRWGDSAILDDIESGTFKMPIREVQKQKYIKTLDDIENGRLKMRSNGNDDTWGVISKKMKPKCEKRDCSKLSYGIIKMWNSGRGFGFVTLDSSKQALNANEKKSAQNGVFLHMSQLDIDNVNKGDMIEYNLVFNNDLNKPQAFKAKRINRK